MTDQKGKASAATDVHTELRPHDEAAIAAAKKAEAKRAGADMLPDPDPEDGLDELFNDLPV